MIAAIEGYDFASVLPIGLGATAGVLLLHFVIAGRRVRREPRPRPGFIARALLLVSSLCILMLAATAFGAILTTGHMSGWPLLIHTLVGGGAVVALALLATWRSGANRFRRGDDRFAPLAKLSFWLVLVSATLSGGTMMAAALPVFDTAGMKTLIDVHRWAGLALTCATAIHVYYLVLGRKGRA